MSKLQYDSKNVKEFLSLLQVITEGASFGVEEKVYEASYKLIGSKDLGTVYLCFLIGKLLSFEAKIAQSQVISVSKSVNVSDLNQQDNEFDNLSVEDIIRDNKLGLHSINTATNALLVGRKESIRKRYFEEDQDVVEEEQAQLETLTPLQIFNRGTVIHNILFLSLFYRYDIQNPTLLMLLEVWLSNRKTVSSIFSREIKEAVIPPMETLLKYVQTCTNFEYFTFQDADLSPPLSLFDPTAVLPAYVYIRLQTICRIPKYSDIIIREIITALLAKRDKLSTLNFLMLVFPQLHFEDNSILQELMKVLSHLYIEPHPVGALAKNALNMLKRDFISPGAAMRERFERSLKMVYNPAEPSIPKEVRRIIPLIYNPYCNFSANINKFDLHAELLEDEIDNCKANLLLNAIEFAEGIESDELLDVPLESLACHYRQVANIMKAAEEEGLLKYKEELLSIKKRILQEKRPGTKYCVRMKSPRLPDVGINCIKIPVKDDLQTLPKEKRIYPKTNLVGILTNLVNAAKDETASGESCECTLIIAGGSGTLQHFSQALVVLEKLGLLKSVTFKVYLLPLGNQNYLSNWLENHDGWYGRNVHYPSLLLLPTFPWMKNGCDYFDPSKFNGVYDRRGKKVSDSKTSVYQLLKYKAPKGFLTPHRIYRTLLNNYLIDARQAHPVNVFTVQCLTHEISTEKGAAVDKSSRIKDYIGLCFCQRIEIGTHVEAMFHKKELRLDDNVTVEEVVKSKSFKDPKTPLAVSYSPMDTAMTASATVVAEPSKFYQSIMIKNVSKFGDKAPLANPCQGWLEVALIDDVVAKKKKKNRDCDQAQSVHVENVTIDSNGPMKFPILMDGELYGPFHKIIIECKNRLQFDLMTFKRN